MNAFQQMINRPVTMDLHVKSILHPQNGSIRGFGAFSGIDSSGKVNGISFTELNETPGMGMRVDEPAFRDQFNDKDVTKFTLNKAGGSTADNEIDSVSGASTTSGAVVNAVNAALDFYHSVVKGAM